MARRVKIVDGELVDLGPVVADPNRKKRKPTPEDDPVFRICQHAKRTGNARAVARLLRGHWPLNDHDRELLADLIEQAKFKRPRGNPRRRDGYVAIAVEVARCHKRTLYRLGWKKAKGQRSIDDHAIGTAIGYMEHCEYPMLPDVETFRERVHTELRRALRKPQPRT